MDEQRTRLESALDEDFGETLTGLMDDKTCEDVVLNEDGMLWVKRFGKDWSPAGMIGATTALAIIKTVARLRDLEASHKNPLVETVLPNGARFEGVLPPIVRKPIFSIRLRAGKVFTFDDYQAQGVLSPYFSGWLQSGIEDGKTILISGSTGSGKTTFLNTCVNHMRSLREKPRLVIIEDTPEIQCTVPNHVSLLANRETSMLACLRTALRLRPSRIVVGEVRGGEALEMCKAFNTGHSGGLATVHANNAHDALTRLESLVQEAVPGYDSRRLIATAIKVVVHIDGGGSGRGRRVTNIISVDGLRGSEYDVQAVLAQ